ncbi:MAG: hypoxanthine phosphoribosyltransferase [Chloroflexi bacterium]|nr:hypoxanthine phosphoribosyltransferase [Chloroflexota bacterium]
MMDEIQSVYVSAENIQQRVIELGQAISRDYVGKNPVLVGALKGVLCFMADLIRAITIPIEVDLIAISSYSQEARQKGLVRMVKDLDLPITGRHVLFVEDVIDTGLTLNYLINSLRARQPASIEVCVLFDKNQHRLIDLPIRYKGFELPDYFVVGYGLDYHERFRNLPFVGILKPEVLFNRRQSG